MLHLHTIYISQSFLLFWKKEWERESLTWYIRVAGVHKSLHHTMSLTIYWSLLNECIWRIKIKIEKHINDSIVMQRIPKFKFLVAMGVFKSQSVKLIIYGKGFFNFHWLEDFKATVCIFKRVKIFRNQGIFQKSM